MQLKVATPTVVIALPYMSIKVVQQVLTFFSGLVETGATPMALAFYALIVHPTFSMDPRMTKLQGPIFFLI